MYFHKYGFTTYPLPYITFSPHMNRLRQLVAILLNPTDDVEDTHVALEAAGVPISFADCRNCPNPCEDGKQLNAPIPWDNIHDRHDFRDVGVS